MPRPIALFTLLAFAVPATAHDLWLIPPSGAKANERITVKAISGMEFPKGDRAPDPTKFAKRRGFDPTGKEFEVEAAGMDDKAGLLTFSPKASGIYAVAVESSPKVLQLDAEAFNDYLVSDGLPHIYKLRSKEKTLDRPAVERYSKSPKALFKVGDGKTGDATKPLGLPLEIVPLADPFTKKVGEALKVKVLFREKPLADANLGWSHPGDGDAPAGTVRTDAKGEALVPLAKTGPMTIRLTHMTRPKSKDYEWESFWTTLTFELAE